MVEISFFLMYNSLFFALAFNAKHFAIAVPFFFFLIPSAVLGPTEKSFLSKFRQMLLQRCVIKIGSTSLDTPANYCVYFLKFLCAWHAMCFRHLSESMWNLAVQPHKASYLHYYDVYGHQNWQGGDLP